MFSRGDVDDAVTSLVDSAAWIFPRTSRGLKKQGSEKMLTREETTMAAPLSSLPPPPSPWSCAFEDRYETRGLSPTARRRSPGRCSHPHPPHTCTHVCSHWPQALKTAPRLIDQQHNKDAAKAAGAEWKMPACVWIKEGTQEREDHQAQNTVIFRSFTSYTLCLGVETHVNACWGSTTSGRTTLA